MAALAQPFPLPASSRPAPQPTQAAGEDGWRTYTVQEPAGRKIRIRAQDEATAIRGAQEWAASNPKTPSPPDGFVPDAGSGPSNTNATQAGKQVTLSIGGRRVKVGAEFLQMTPEQQNAAVEEIASQAGITGGQHGSQNPELARLEEGIRRAHAAGNADHVRILGQAYRELQAPGSAIPPPPPGFETQAATLQRIEAALRAADAAGNVDDARRLAAAYREMQSATSIGPIARPEPGSYGNAIAPEGLKPGTREYADWAAQQARAGKKLPTVSEHQTTESSILDPLVQGITFGWGDELRGVAQGAMAAAQGGDFHSTYNQTVDEARNALDRERRVNPVGSFAAEMGGSMATGLGGGLQLVKQGASLGARALTGAVVGAGQGAVYGAGSADDARRGEGALIGGALGGAVGLAAPYVGNAIQSKIQGAAQTSITNAALKGAPSADDLKAAASSMFQQVDSSGVGVDPTYFGGRVLQMAQKAGKGLIDKELDAPAWRMFHVIASRVKAAHQAGRGLSLGEIHNLRQIAQDVAMNAGKGRTARFANEVIDGLDDIVGHLKPAQLTGGQGNVGNVLLGGISTWSRARKVGLIEEAIYKAQNQASGMENGLRTQFRALLQNPKTRKLFTPAEVDAIHRVVRGTTAANITKLIGKFGFGNGNASNMLGGTIGFGAGSMSPLGPVGGVLAAGGATLARRGSEALTSRAANRAAQVVATPNIPSLPPVSPRLPTIPENVVRSLGAPLSGQTNPPRPPLRIVIDGANPVY